MSNYRIEFSNKAKDPFEVQYRSFNTATSLTLPGKNSVNYGYEVNSDLYHLLEHFCNDLPPTNPIQGQTWFNTKTDKLNIYDQYWTELGNTNRPKTPVDSISNAVLDITLDQLLKSTGGQMQGDILLKDTTPADSEWAAVTKEYVDSFIKPVPDNIIKLSGNEIPTINNIILPDIPLTNPLQAATKAYADANVPKLTKYVDNPFTGSAGDTNGYCNIVTLLPSGLTFIFGVEYMKAENSYVDMNFASIGPFSGASIHVNPVDADPGVTYSAKTIMGGTGVSSVRIIKYGSQTRSTPTSIYYSMVAYR